MEVRPGYKETEIGVIPEDWEVTPLSTLCRSICDGTHFTPRYVAEGIPFYSVENVTANDFSNTKFISEGEHAMLVKRCKPERGDILMTRIGSLGDTKLLDWDVKASIYVSLALLKPGELVNSEYLYRYSRSRAFVLDVEKRSLLNATPKKINMGDIGAIPIPVPRSIREQKAIAEALSDADALIESLEQLLAKKRQLKQGAMQELLTGKKRLPGFEIRPGHRQTEVGVIPEDWEVQTLASVCSMRSGDGITSASIDQSSRYPCYGGNGLRGFTTRFTHDGRYALIGRQGALCGNVLGVEGKFFASEHAIVVTPSSRTDCRWLTFVLGEMRLNQYSESSAQPGLSVSKLLRLDLVCPPTKAEEEAIAAILSDMDAEIAGLEAKVAKARALKQGMMQELLTGRIRLV